MGRSFNANSPSPYVARSGKRLKQIRADKQFKLPRTTDPLNAPLGGPRSRGSREREKAALEEATTKLEKSRDEVRLRVSVTNRQLSL